MFGFILKAYQYLKCLSIEYMEHSRGATFDYPGALHGLCWFWLLIVIDRSSNEFSLNVGIDTLVD